MATSQTLIATLFFEKASYDLIRNYSPVSVIASTPYVLVANPALGVRSTKELIALAKAKPGTLHYGSSGTGGALHVAAEMFTTMSGIDLVHVPYKSVVFALVDVMSGQVQLAFSVVPAALPLIKQGKLRPLGVTSRTRSALVPEVETIDEAVPGYENIGWYGLVAPLKTPARIIDRLNAEIVRIVKSAEMRAKLNALGADPIGTTPEEFTAFLARETEKLRKAIKASGIRPE
jgi:tripartite-type tricarboxylate transporter receptor subunit TctC